MIFVKNECGELLNVQLTPGNMDDRKPVPELMHNLFGKVFGDPAGSRVAARGYVSKKLAQQLLETQNIEFFAKPRRNMKSRHAEVSSACAIDLLKNKLMRLNDKLLCRKRAIIETIIDQLKNISQIEHSRHRSPVNFCVNILCGLIAYCHQPKKPSIQLNWVLAPSA